MKRFDYIALAEDIAALSAKIAGELLYEKKIGYGLGLRDRVAVGLILKIGSSFRALMTPNSSEASRCTTESMHHLKTMTEAAIYFHVVLRDESDRAALDQRRHVEDYAAAIDAFHRLAREAA